MPSRNVQSGNKKTSKPHLAKEQPTFLPSVISSFLFTVFTVALPLLLIAGQAEATSYYVSPSGNDANAGTSVSSPWRTISKVNGSSFGPGDSILFERNAIWKEVLTIRSKGSSSSPVIYGAYGSGVRPRIDGNNRSLGSGGLVQVNGAQYVLFQDMEVAQSASFGVFTTNSSYLAFKNCFVNVTGDGGLVFHGGLSGSGTIHHVTIDSCEVNMTNQKGLDAAHEGISLENVDTFEVKHSRVHHCGEEGINAKYGARNGSIHHNLSHDNNGPNIYIDASHDIDIYNNAAYNSSSTKKGISLNTEYMSSSLYTYNINVFNNLVYNNGGGMSFWLESGTESYARYSNIRIINNVFYNNTSGGIGAILFVNGGSNFTTGNVIRNNIFWGNGKSITDTVGATAGFAIDHNLFKSADSSSTFGQNAIVTSTSPFVSAGSDFRLRSDSQAVDAGSATNAPPFDFGDYQRPSGNGYDIGAYEYASGTTIVAPTISFSASPNSITAGLRSVLTWSTTNATSLFCLR